MENLTQQIPKIIHYCWFGGKEKSSLMLKCIDSWRKYLPDYEIKEWNEGNFDTNIVKYTKEAYAAKKYAFVSDYARFWILYNYGGLYFDTDVEVIKSMDRIVENGAFMGFENTKISVIDSFKSIIGCNPGLGIGCAPGLGIYKEILDLYNNMDFINVDNTYNLTTIVQNTTEILRKHGLKKDNKIQKIEGMTIYPTEYFCPKYLDDGKYKITKNTYSIHHYAASWVDDVRNFYNLRLPFGLILKFYVCKEETKGTNILPEDEKPFLKFYKNKKRYIVLTLKKRIYTKYRYNKR